MQYPIIFMAVLIVGGLMTGFLVLAIKQQLYMLSDQVEERFLKELGTFDAVYEEKAAKLRKLKAEQALYADNIFKKQEKSESPVQTTEKSSEKKKTPVRERTAAAVFSLPSGRTVSSSFFEDYRYVRDTFRIDPEEVVGIVASIQMDTGTAQRAAAAGLLTQLDADTAFELSTMRPEDQYEIINGACADDAQRKLLADFAEESRSGDLSRFSALAFREELLRQGTTDDTITVYTADPSLAFDDPQIKVQYDPNICEGVRILRGGRMFDYSI